MYEILLFELNMYYVRFFFLGRRCDGFEYELEILREYFGSFVCYFCEYGYWYNIVELMVFLLKGSFYVKM